MSLLDKMYKKNIEYCRKVIPELAAGIEAEEIDDIELVDYNDDFNIKINGEYLYPINAENMIGIQSRHFILNSKRPALYKRPSLTKAEHEIARISEGYVKKLQEASPYLINNKDFTGYKLRKNLPVLLVFGVGSGHHIKTLVENLKIRNLIIVDNNYKLLKVSFHLIDWTNIIEYFRQNRLKIQVIVSEKPRAICGGIINDLYEYTPFFQNYIPYYTHYQSKFFDEVKDNLLDIIELGFTGWGFYDDEVISLNHTVNNLKKKIPLFNKMKDLTNMKNSIAFVIGSGPSIDEDIEFIKANKDNAVIFSCSSSLKILENNGIVPDYHIEIERTILTYDYLNLHFSKDYLKKINFIGLNVIPPKVFDLFKTAKMFLRNNDAGSSIIDNDKYTQLEHTNPTSVNGAVNFVCEVGFEELYLFGVDQGYKNIESHHSKHSPYFSSKITKEDDEKVKNNYLLGKREVEGNFENSKIFTTTELFWGKQRLENCFVNFKNLKVLNCSDGVKIRHTTPIHSDSLEISNSYKDNVITDIEKCFEIVDLEDIVLDKQLKGLISVIDSMYSIFERHNDIKTYDELLYVLESSYLLIVNNYKEYNLMSSFLSGTVAQLYQTLFTHSACNEESIETMDYIKEGLNIVKEFLEEVKNKYKDKDINSEFENHSL